MRYNRLYEQTNFIVPTDHTQRLSQFVSGLRYEDLPAAVVYQARELLLQSVAAAWASVSSPEAKKALATALARNGGDGGPCIAWGGGIRLSAINAAQLSATLADLLDWTDASPVGRAAPAITAAAWAMAQERHCSGRELLTAIVAAYEVQARIALAVHPGPDQRERESWGEISWAIFGATIAAAKLCRLDPRRVDQAIGIACECSTIPATYYAATFSEADHYDMGFRARDGVMIAKSAEKGIHNQRDTLDDPCCYTCGMTTDLRTEEFTKALGEDYLILNTRIKRLPTDVWNEDAALMARAFLADGLLPEEVVKITVSPVVRRHMDLLPNGFISSTHRQLCLPWAVACGLSSREPGPAWYEGSPADMPISSLVSAGEECALIDRYDLWQAGGHPHTQMTVEKTDGTVLTGSDPGQATAEELKALFHQKVSSSLDPEAAETLWAALSTIDEAEDVAALTLPHGK